MHFHMSGVPASGANARYEFTTSGGFVVATIEARTAAEAREQAIARTGIRDLHCTHLSDGPLRCRCPGARDGGRDHPPPVVTPARAEPRREAKRMTGSQYTADYLASTARGDLATVHTFLSRVLRGRAKDYAAKYARALERDLERRVDVGTARRVASTRGGVAYVPAGTSAAG